MDALRIGDPAVGSGHFLVSALNELIAIKSELRVLTDTQGKRLSGWHVEVVNDELVVTDRDTSDAYQYTCLLYTSPSPRDRTRSRMPSSA